MNLDRLLGALDVSVEAFAVCDVRTGTALELDAPGAVEVHYVLRGSGTVEVPNRVPLAFAPQSVLIIPPGLGHRLVPDAEGDPLRATDVCVQPSEGIAWIRRGLDSGPQTLLMVCGTVRATVEGGLDLFGSLRDPVAVDCRDAPPVGAAFDAMLHEQAHPGPGSRTLVSIGMTTVFVHVLRELWDATSGALPWLAALGDDRLAAALGEMVEHPERSHSVVALAATAGMSRSAFADHFSRTFDATPMDMLRELRVRRAAYLLEHSDLPVKVVADRVGYASRSQFSRVFKASTGADPSTYRSERRSA